MDRPILLISTPRSGSDWLAQDCLLWRAPDYFREYYNAVTNFERGNIIRQAFGSEVDWENLAVPWECQDDVCEYVHQATWARDHHRFAKENYAAFKIGFFRKHFDCFALIGHRRHTFPGASRPRWTEHWWCRYFQSLEFNLDLLDGEIARLVRWALEGPLDLRRKMVAAQVIVTYQTIRECLRHQIPILEYRRLIELDSPGEAFGYLSGKVPAPLMDEGLADRVIGTMRASDKSGRYEAWGVEEFALGLVDQIPPEIRPYFRSDQEASP